MILTNLFRLIIGKGETFPRARRGDRVVDGTGLENRQGVTAFEGSNPSLSAMKKQSHLGLFFHALKRVHSNPRFCAAKHTRDRCSE